MFHCVENGTGGDEESGRKSRVGEGEGGLGGGLSHRGSKGAEGFEGKALRKREGETGKCGEGKYDIAGRGMFEPRNVMRNRRREGGEDARGEPIVGKVGVMLTKQRGEPGVVVGRRIHVCGFHDASRWRSFSLPRAR